MQQFISQHNEMIMFLIGAFGLLIAIIGIVISIIIWRKKHAERAVELYINHIDTDIR